MSKTPKAAAATDAVLYDIQGEEEIKLPELAHKRSLIDR